MRVRPPSPFPLVLISESPPPLYVRVIPANFDIINIYLIIYLFSKTWGINNKSWKASERKQRQLKSLNNSSSRLRLSGQRNSTMMNMRVAVQSKSHLQCNSQEAKAEKTQVLPLFKVRSRRFPTTQKTFSTR